MIIGIIAARPGSILMRDSREMSFGPNTKPESRVTRFARWIDNDYSLEEVYFFWFHRISWLVKNLCKQ